MCLEVSQQAKIHLLFEAMMQLPVQEFRPTAVEGGRALQQSGLTAGL